MISDRPFCEIRDEIIDNAIINEAVIEFLYEKSAEVLEQRKLSPYECSEDGTTMLGYDHNRDELRRFELSKILTIGTAAHDEYVKPIEKEAV